MKYQPPANSIVTEDDPEPAYFNGNPQAGQKGAIPPAKAIEDPQREIMAVIQAAGLTPDAGDLTQLLQAIQILAAGAGATSAVFIYNPVYPDVISNGGVMSIAASNGQIVLASGQQFIHRGGELYNTTNFSSGDRTFSTVASKTYHLRWRYNGGTPVLVLLDVTNGTYNPGALPESDVSFDTTYDDMLIAKVVTDASNNPTVTALKNLARLTGIYSYYKSSGITLNVNSTGRVEDAAAIYNWARRPATRSIEGTLGATTTAGHGIDAIANEVIITSMDRYALVAMITTDFAATVTGIFARASFNVSA